MISIFRTLVLVLVVLFVVGCLGRDGSQIVVVPPDEPKVTSIHFDVRGTKVVQDGEPNGGNIEIPNGSATLIVEAKWACSAGPCDLELRLFGPDRLLQGSATGTQNARLSVASPAIGTWNAQMWCDPAAVAQGEIRATVSERLLSANYTAFP